MSDTFGSSFENNKERTGRWTRAENEYASALIDAFHSGRLDIQEGISLRRLLSEKLNCSVKRISKKYEGTHYSGKQLYSRDETATDEEMEAMEGQIQLLEDEFLASLNEDGDSKEQQDIEKKRKATSDISSPDTLKKQKVAATAIPSLRLNHSIDNSNNSPTGSVVSTGEMAYTLATLGNPITNKDGKKTPPPHAAALPAGFPGATPEELSAFLLLQRRTANATADYQPRTAAGGNRGGFLASIPGSELLGHGLRPGGRPDVNAASSATTSLNARHLLGLNDPLVSRQAVPAASMSPADPLFGSLLLENHGGRTNSSIYDEYAVFAARRRERELELLNAAASSNASTASVRTAGSRSLLAASSLGLPGSRLGVATSAADEELYLQMMMNQERHRLLLNATEGISSIPLSQHAAAASLAATTPSRGLAANQFLPGGGFNQKYLQQLTDSEPRQDLASRVRRSDEAESKI